MFLNYRSRSILNAVSIFKSSEFNFMNLIKRNKSNGINVSNYETGFNPTKPPTDQSLVDELDLLNLSFEPQESNNSTSDASSNAASPQSRSSDSRVSGDRRHPNRSLTNKYPTGGVAKQRCYNCGQIGHISFDCQQPQVRKACYTCGNSGHLARDCPQSQRPIICYVCRQPGHLASKCPSSTNGQIRSNNNNNNNNNNEY